MNIRTTLIRTSLAIALVAACATAANLQLDASRTAQNVAAANDALQVQEKLDVTLLPAINVTAKAPPLSVTLLPTVHVSAPAEQIADAKPPSADGDSVAANTPVKMRFRIR